jgi:hypothetical protein
VVSHQNPGDDSDDSLAPFDKVALESLLSDPEVRQWIKDMGSYLPAQR